MGAGDAETEDGTVWLADAIELVRRELDAAQREGEGSAWRFTVERVSLEFAVQFHRAGDGHAGLRLGVVEARLGGSASRDTTHRINVELQPYGDAGRMPVSRGEHAPDGGE
ncbi:MAG: trypco2 family protein, partial [Streptomyces sp.]|uniref:trypco2 family protein n=1 Tax=Streptomyces sp. TaxID=1931 RepID=UPI003D6B5A3E